MDLEKLKEGYELLFELTEDQTEFRWFKTKKEYMHKVDLLRDEAAQAGLIKEFENYVRTREIEFYLRYELRKGLKGHRLRPASDYKANKAVFLWEPYLPLNEYTVMMAAGGTGKTYLVCGIAAAISTGTLPMQRERTEPKNVLIISGEDRGGELRARIASCGGDLDKIYIMDCLESMGMNLSSNLDEFGAFIQRSQAKLVVIDPWQAFLGADVDINRVNSVRPILQAISNLARSNKCAILMISHVGKRSQTENINHSAIGSTDLINAARSVLMVAFADRPEERLMVHTKSNHASPGKSILFAITEREGIDWRGYSEVDRRTLEENSKYGKSAAELLHDKKEELEELQPLADALRTIAVPGERKKISYQWMRENYGEEIFANRIPKKALDHVKELLPGLPLEINASKSFRRIREDGSRGPAERGFELYLRENEEQRRKRLEAIEDDDEIKL